MVRGWGLGSFGRRDYGDTDKIGDNETAGPVGPMHLGLGGTALTVSADLDHTCALLDNGVARCWGGIRQPSRLGQHDRHR